jgi:hypothetical protein
MNSETNLTFGGSDSVPPSNGRFNNINKGGGANVSPLFNKEGGI